MAYVVQEPFKALEKEVEKKQKKAGRTRNSEDQISAIEAAQALEIVEKKVGLNEAAQYTGELAKEEENLGITLRGPITVVVKENDIQRLFSKNPDYNHLPFMTKQGPNIGMGNMTNLKEKALGGKQIFSFYIVESTKKSNGNLEIVFPSGAGDGSIRVVYPTYKEAQDAAKKITSLTGKKIWILPVKHQGGFFYGDHNTSYSLVDPNNSWS